MSQIHCPHCKRELLSEKNTSEKILKCPSCKKSFKLSAPQKNKKETAKSDIFLPKKLRQQTKQVTTTDDALLCDIVEDLTKSLQCLLPLLEKRKLDARQHDLEKAMIEGKAPKETVKIESKNDTRFRKTDNAISAFSKTTQIKNTPTIDFPPAPKIEEESPVKTRHNKPLPTFKKNFLRPIIFISIILFSLSLFFFLYSRKPQKKSNPKVDKVATPEKKALYWNW